MTLADFLVEADKADDCRPYCPTSVLMEIRALVLKNARLDAEAKAKVSRIRELEKQVDRLETHLVDNS